MSRSLNRLVITTIAITLYGIAIGVAMSAFNNFLNDTYHLSPDERGWLELPREFPGFMTAVTASLLFFLADKRLAVLATCVAAFGQVMMVSMGESYTLMVLFMMIWAVGDHLYFPIKSALVLACCKEDNRGRILGVTGSFEVAGIILGGIITRLAAGLDAGYLIMFSWAAGANLLAGFCFLFIPQDHLAAGKRPRMVFRARYRLYYVLEFLFGARKQIFLTFGPWVLIQVFDQGVETFAVLTIIGHFMALLARPVVGWAVDRFGERTVLMADGSLLILVCLGYGFSNHIPVAAWALPAALGCFLLDQLLFYVGIARTTYLAKIVEDKRELAASLTAGVSINHIASMTIPIFAGAVWKASGHEYLFLGAAVFAVLIVLVSSRVPKYKQ
ncbi:MAG: MFS transporter [bacterium]